MTSGRVLGAGQGDPQKMPLPGVNVTTGPGQSSRGFALRFGAENLGRSSGMVARAAGTALAAAACPSIPGKPAWARLSPPAVPSHDPARARVAAVRTDLTGAGMPARHLACRGTGRTSWPRLGRAGSRKQPAAPQVPAQTDQIPSARLVPLGGSRHLTLPGMGLPPRWGVLLLVTLCGRAAKMCLRFDQGCAVAGGARQPWQQLCCCLKKG